MINVLINGSNGKMGQEIVKQIEQIDNIQTICGVSRTTGIQNKFPTYTNIQEIKEKPDVIIDFSIPKATFLALEYAKEKKIPIVIATTGFTEEEENKIKEYSKYIPVFKSYNMSYETFVMADVVSKLATLLKDSDIEIIETHHNKKVDSPSGTAYILANKINEAKNSTMVYEYNRHSRKGPRQKNEIGIHSIRGGTEVGKHTVKFFSDNERFEITHTVTSRGLFGKGAIKAAEFIVNKPNGYYEMYDLIK